MFWAANFAPLSIAMEQRRAGGPSIGSMRAMKAIMIDAEPPARCGRGWPISPG
jgi:hypothetical protein